MMNFQNQTERAFYDYMMSKIRYKESTVLHYIVRLRKIMSMDQLVHQNLDSLIRDFESGKHCAENIRSHSATSCALKHLRAFKRDKGII